MKVFPVWFWPVMLLWNALSLAGYVVAHEWHYAPVSAVGVCVSVACIVARHKEQS